MVWGFFLRKVKRPRPELEQCLGKGWWSCTSVAWYLTEHRNDFTFLQFLFDDARHLGDTWYVGQQQ
jgi:hypothetical protein